MLRRDGYCVFGNRSLELLVVHVTVVGEFVSRCSVTLELSTSIQGCSAISNLLTQLPNSRLLRRPGYASFPPLGLGLREARAGTQVRKRESGVGFSATGWISRVVSLTLCISLTTRNKSQTFVSQPGVWRTMWSIRLFIIRTPNSCQYTGKLLLYLGTSRQKDLSQGFTLARP